MQILFSKSEKFKKHVILDILLPLIDNPGYHHEQHYFMVGYFMPYYNFYGYSVSFSAKHLRCHVSVSASTTVFCFLKFSLTEK